MLFKKKNSCLSPGLTCVTVLVWDVFDINFFLVGGSAKCLFSSDLLKVCFEPLVGCAVVWSFAGTLRAHC